MVYMDSKKTGFLKSQIAKMDPNYNKSDLKQKTRHIFILPPNIFWGGALSKHIYNFPNHSILFENVSLISREQGLKQIFRETIEN